MKIIQTRSNNFKIQRSTEENSFACASKNTTNTGYLKLETMLFKKIEVKNIGRMIGYNMVSNTLAMNKKKQSA
jgi:hypothetical protein